MTTTLSQTYNLASSFVSTRSIDLAVDSVYPGVTAECEHTGTPKIVAFRAKVEKFPALPANVRDAERRAIIQEIRFGHLTSEHPISEYLNTAVDALLAGSLPGRIDDAIAILSEVGQDVDLAAPASRALAWDQLDDDYRYVWVRARARSHARDTVAEFLQWCSQSEHEAVREAAVEELGELGDSESLALVRRLHTEDNSAVIRELAADIIEECTE